MGIAGFAALRARMVVGDLEKLAIGALLCFGSGFLGIAELIDQFEFDRAFGAEPWLYANGCNGCRGHARTAGPERRGHLCQ